MVDLRSFMSSKMTQKGTPFSWPERSQNHNNPQNPHNKSPGFQSESPGLQNDPNGGGLCAQRTGYIYINTYINIFK